MGFAHTRTVMLALVLLLQTSPFLPPSGQLPDPSEPPARVFVDEHPNSFRLITGSPQVLVGDTIMGGVCPTGVYEAFTARHVLETGKDGPIVKKFKLIIAVEGSSPYIVDAEVVQDFGIVHDIVKIGLSPKAEGFPVFYKRASRLPRHGEPVTSVFTFPGTLDRRQASSYAVTHGWYYGFDSESGYLYSDAKISAGSSGTCLLNENGEAYAITTALRTFGNADFSHAISAAKPILKSLWK